MKSVFKVCLVVVAAAGLLAAQETTQPPLQKGISVEMPVANHAVPVPDADKPGATIVTITNTGDIFVGTQRADSNSLSDLRGNVYLKADAHAPYEKVLGVLDALAGRSVVLLSSSTNAASGGIVAPRGIKVAVAGQ